MWLYSDKKIDDTLAPYEHIYFTKAVSRPYERFDILDTADFIHSRSGVLITADKTQKLRLYKAGQSYSLSLNYASVPLDVLTLRKSPLKEIILSASDAPLSASIPVSLVVDTFYIRTENDIKGIKVTKRRSANSKSGYLFELSENPVNSEDSAGSALGEIMPLLKEAGFVPLGYAEYLLQSFMTGSSREELMKERIDRETPVFTDVLLNQLDHMQYSLADFNQTGSVASMEKLNDSIFNFYVLYFGRFSEASIEAAGSEDLTEFAMVVSEIAAEIAVFDHLLTHLDEFDESDPIVGAVIDVTSEDRDRSYDVLREVCADLEQQGLISDMRTYIRSLSPESEEKYLKYRNKKAKKLLKKFHKKHARLEKKRSAARYNDFYEALANIYVHMELIGLFSTAENFNKIRSKIKKYIEAMEDYSSRLNIAVLMREYQEELELDDIELDALELPKASKKELKKLLDKTEDLIDYLD